MGRPLTREQKMAIARVFVDHLKRREAIERRAKERGGGSKLKKDPDRRARS